MQKIDIWAKIPDLHYTITKQKTGGAMLRVTTPLRVVGKIGICSLEINDQYNLVAEQRDFTIKGDGAKNTEYRERYEG